MVAHHIDIVEVVGSSPISPTIKRQMTSVICLFIMIDFEFGREPTQSGALLKVRADLRTDGVKRVR